MRLKLCLLLFFGFNSMAHSGVVPREIEEGIIFNSILKADKLEDLRRYARRPEAKQSSDMLNLIISNYPYTGLEIIHSKHVILFLSIEGINQVVHIGKSGGFKKEFVEPDEIRLDAQEFIAAWIVDNINRYSTSVELDITKSTRSVSLSTFESQSESGGYGGGDEYRNIEIGIKYFKIPTYYGNMDITFVRRDKDTFETRIWKRNFRITFVPSILGVSAEADLLLPITSSETRRYDVVSGLIRENKIDPEAFLTITFFSPPEKRFSRGLLENIIPDPFVGVGLMYDFDRARNNSYLVGFSWRYRSDLFRLCLALQFGDKLLAGYRVGDSVAEGERVADKYHVKPLIGVSVSLSYISELLTGI